MIKAVRIDNTTSETTGGDWAATGKLYGMGYKHVVVDHVSPPVTVVTDTMFVPTADEVKQLISADGGTLVLEDTAFEVELIVIGDLAEYVQGE